MFSIYNSNIDYLSNDNSKQLIIALRNLENVNADVYAIIYR